MGSTIFFPCKQKKLFFLPLEMYSFENEVNAILSLDYNSKVAMTMGVLDGEGNQLPIKFTVHSLYHWCVLNKIWSLQNMEITASCITTEFMGDTLEELHANLETLVALLPEGDHITTINHCPAHMLRVYFRTLMVYYDDNGITTFRDLQRKVIDSLKNVVELREFITSKARDTGNDSFGVASEVLADALLEVLHE